MTNKVVIAIEGEFHSKNENDFGGSLKKQKNAAKIIFKFIN